jgi:hypothetical protein
MVKNYGGVITFNGMNSLLNFIKIYQLVQKLTHKEYDLISPHFSFWKESRLKMRLDNIILSFFFYFSVRKCSTLSALFLKPVSHGTWTTLAVLESVVKFIKYFKGGASYKSSGTSELDHTGVE